MLFNKNLKEGILLPSTGRHTYLNKKALHICQCWKEFLWISLHFNYSRTYITSRALLRYRKFTIHIFVFYLYNENVDSRLLSLHGLFYIHIVCMYWIFLWKQILILFMFLPINFYFFCFPRFMTPREEKNYLAIPSIYLSVCLPARYRSDEIWYRYPSWYRYSVFKFKRQWNRFFIISVQGSGEIG